MCQTSVARNYHLAAFARMNRLVGIAARWLFLVTGVDAWYDPCCVALWKVQYVRSYCSHSEEIRRLLHMCNTLLGEALCP